MKRLISWVKNLQISPWVLVFIVLSASAVGAATQQFPKQTIGSGDGTGYLASVNAAGQLEVTGSSANNSSVGPNNVTAPTSDTLIGSIDSGGKLQAASASNPIPITGAITANNPSVGTLGSTAPTSGTYIGVLSGSNLVGVSAANPLPASVAALPLPTGASTAALQTTGNGYLSTLATNLPAQGQALAAGSLPVVLTAAQISTLTPLTSVAVTQGTASNLNATVVGSGTAGTPSGGVVSVQGVASGTVLPVSVASLPLPTGAATSANQTNATQKTQIVDGSGNVIASTSNALNVAGTIVSGPGYETQTGTITNNATTISLVVKQYSTAIIQTTGTYAGITENFKVSYDNGTTYQPFPMTLVGITPTAPVTSVALATNASVVYQANLEGATNFEVVSSAYTSGTANVVETATTNPVTNYEPVGITNTPTVILGAGSALAGKFGIDQTTPGTTNLVAAGQNGTWTVQPGNTANTTAWLVAGGKTNNNAAPGATNLGVLPVLANASNPSWTEGDMVTLSALLNGALRTDATTYGGTAVVTGGVNGSTGVGGLAASGASASGNPLQAGGVANTTEPTAVSAGQIIALYLDKVGKLIISPFAARENYLTGTASATGTGATALIASQGGSLKIYPTSISCGNSGATTTAVAFENGSGGTTLATLVVPAGGGNNVTFPTPLTGMSAATGFYMASGSSTTTLYCNVTGYSGY